MQKFKLGDKVKWKSSASGTWKEKTGEIVYIVKENIEHPTRKWLELKFKASAAPLDEAWPRDHESYIVRVPSGTKAKDKLYWPLVSKLELVHEF